MKIIYLFLSCLLKKGANFLNKLSNFLEAKFRFRNTHDQYLNLRDGPWISAYELNKDPNVSIGKFTYGLDSSTIIRPTKDAPVKIGNFCSFAPGVKLLAHADHLTTSVSTFPFRTLFCNYYDDNSFDPLWSNHDAVTKGPINIGNDVWVGQNVLILSGVTIGNGAIIGAGSVVTKDIPHFSIAVGNPAKVIKYRFTSEVIDQLNQIQWWDFSDQELIRLIPQLYHSPELFLKLIKEPGKKS